MTLFGMRYFVATLFLLASVSQAADAPALTLPQYVDELQTYENQVAELAASPQKALAFRDSIPETLAVQTSHGNMSVDLSFLRDSMNRYLTAAPSAKLYILSSTGSQLQALRMEAPSYVQPNRADGAMRKQLDQILSAREFDRVRGPTALELLRQRITAWIAHLLRKINPKLPDIEDAGQWFVWGMIGLVSAIAAIWLYRVSRRNMGSAQREILPFMPSSRSWKEWLADSRARAAKEEWRDAIHFGFWAAVSRLESEGAWSPDKTRTPREYLNAIPGSSSSKEPFAAVTRKFEASWYGSRPTTAADFAQFASYLERLGCR